MNYVGIDPGKNGGIACVEDSGKFLWATKMPADLEELDEIFGGFSRDTRAVLEYVSASPGMGSVSAFTFGSGFGALKMCLVSHRIKNRVVTPVVWQRAMRCLTGGDKNVTKEAAQRAYRHVVVTHVIADAIMIARYARRLHRSGKW